MGSRLRVPGRRRAAAWAVMLLSAAGCAVACGHARPLEPTPESRSLHGAPSTVWDPPAWTPPPAEQPRTGSAVGVAAAGGYDQAREKALAVVRAVRDRERAVLERLLAERVARVSPQLGGGARPRARVIAHVLDNPRRSGLGPDVPLGELLDTERIRVRPLAQAMGDRPIPSGMQGSDLLVTFPLRPQGRRWFRFLFGWRTKGGVVVRPGARPRIIAL